MKIVITGGGTGGHVFPALEIAKYAINNNDNVIYIGSEYGIEKELCSRHNIPIHTLPSKPFYSLKTKRGIIARLLFVKAYTMAKIKLAEIKPDAVFSTGGYSSAPVVFAAKKLKIPYFIHEQNTVPGRANLFFMNHAAAVFTVFSSTERYLRERHFAPKNIIRTGIPLRSSLVENSTHEPKTIPENNAINILVTGGSQGAVAINDVILELASLLKDNPNYQFKWTHLTGIKNYENVLHTRDDFKLKEPYYNILPFADDKAMASLLKNNHLIICRSGAGTLTDSALYGIPSITIPYKYAIGNHQYYNALEFEEMGITKILEQDKLTPNTLLMKINEWINDENQYTAASNILLNWNVEDTVQKVYSNIEHLLNNSTHENKSRMETLQQLLRIR